jgi:small subunit ribosomal protein S17
MPKKIYTGNVISDKMDKTVVVAVTRLTQHPLYKKTIKKIAKFKAHDEENKCKKGDKVSIIESRPLSKDKRWKILDIVRKGNE